LKEPTATKLKIFLNKKVEQFIQLILEVILLEERDKNKAGKPGVMGCFYSHYRLWGKCVELNETIGIFEDDVKVLRPLVPIDFEEVLVVAMGSRKNEKYLAVHT
jgi:hypothetical protein